MSDAKSALFIALGVFTAGFVWMLVSTARRRARVEPGAVLPSQKAAAAGFVTAFFDTLGIGSFATTTAFYRARKTVDDALIPGTLNVGHTIPTFVQAYIYTQIVEVDAQTGGHLLPTAARCVVQGSMYRFPAGEGFSGGSPLR